MVLSRNLAHQNIYPAIDILSSISRLMPEIVDKKHYDNAGKLRNIYSTYMDHIDAIRLGAYKAGSDPKIDEAIKKQPMIENFIRQGIKEAVPFEVAVSEIAKIAGGGK